MRTRLPCSTSPRGAPAAAADMVGGAVVCLPTAGRRRAEDGQETEREREEREREQSSC